MIPGCASVMGLSCLRARLLLSARAAPLCLGLQAQRGYKHHRHKRADPRPSLYSVLGVSPKATQAQIKGAYYKLSKAFHPDRNQGSRVAQERFAAISEAYSVLGSVRLRRRYDRGIFTERDLHSEHHGESATADATSSSSSSSSRAKAAGDAAGRGHQSHSVYYDAHGNRMFDFDEFFKAHYGEARAREQRERELRRRRQEDMLQQREQAKASLGMTLGILGTAILLVGLLIRRE